MFQIAIDFLKILRIVIEKGFFFNKKHSFTFIKNILKAFEEKHFYSSEKKNGLKMFFFSMEFFGILRKNLFIMWKIDGINYSIQR